MANLEIMIAMKTPCMEAEHVLDDRNAFNFYDCLIPKLKEHRRFKLLPDNEFSLADFKCQQKVRQLEWDLEKKQLPKLKEECETLRDRCAQLENEAEVIQWYMKTMERGIDTKDIAREFFKLQEDHSVLVKTTTKSIAQLTKENERLTKELAAAMKELKR